jgi:hypothetical protein
MINQNDRSKTFLGVLLIRRGIFLDQVKSMRTKLISITLLVMLLAAPLIQVSHAQETVPDGVTPEDGTGNSPVDPNSMGNSTDTGLLDGNTTIPVVDSNVTEIDPLIYEMVKTDAEARYAELYELIFGKPMLPVETDIPPAEVPDVNATITDGNATTTSDPLNGTITTGLELNGTEVLLEIPTGYAGPMIPDGTDPAMMNQFVHAWSAMESAESKTNPRAAANQYLRAMKQLRNAYKKFQKDNPVAAGGEVNETGVPLGDIPVEPTDAELSETKQQLVGRFQDRFQERVTQMLENYNDVEGSLSAGDAVKARSALSKAEEKLLRIQTKIDAGAFDGVIDDLDNATETLDGDFETMDDDASKQMFRTMNKLEAKIGKMAERSDRMARRGENTSGLDAEVAKARGNKDQTKTNFKDDKERGNFGNGNGNPDEDTSKPDKDTGKPDKDTGKPDKDKGNQGQGNN